MAVSNSFAVDVDTSDNDIASTMHTCRARGQGRSGRAPSFPVQCPLL